MQQRVKIKASLAYDQAMSVICNLIAEGFDVDSEYFEELDKWQIFGTRYINDDVKVNFKIADLAGSQPQIEDIPRRRSESQETDEESIPDSEGWIYIEDNPSLVIPLDKEIEVLRNDGHIRRGLSSNFTFFYNPEDPSAIKAYRVLEDRDGWIDWHGGECPVGGDTIVEYITGWGAKLKPSKWPVEPAGKLYWGTDSLDPDQQIIKYRVVKGDE